MLWIMFRKNWFWPAAVAFIAWLWCLSALDPTGEYPGLHEGPGLTLDEQFNIEQGVLMVDALIDGRWADFRTEVNALPDHPLLGRLWLGAWHEIAYLLFRPASLPDNSAPPPPPGIPAPILAGSAAPRHPPALSVACARSGSAAAFALLVFLVGWRTSAWYGKLTGGLASLSLVLMPHVFGHAHLAALESSVNLTYAAAALAFAEFADSPRPPSPLRLLGLGGLLGLALLTKIQGVLLTVPVGLWMLWQWRWRAIPTGLAWGLAAGVVFFCCWPWLWDAPWEHARKFLGSSTKRQALPVWYLGNTFADRDVPWHYPWVMFLTTVPVGLHCLGFFGATRQGNLRSREWLLLAVILFPLVLFSIPGVAVYDGTRLFLMVFPLWGVFVGRGAAEAWQWCAARSGPRIAAGLLALLLAGQAYDLFALAPCQLSYYNLCVGGVRGADALGLPCTYWGDTLTRSFLEEVSAAVPPGATLRFIPAMHRFQLQDLQTRSAALASRGQKLLPYNTDGNPQPPHLLLFMRKEAVPAEFHQPPVAAARVITLRRQGVVLAAYYHFPPPSVPRKEPR